MKTPETEKEDKEFLRSIAHMKTRMNGMTTRMVDEFVQKLYKNEGEWVDIYDHYPSIQASKMVMVKVLRRMSLEHPQDKLEIDKLNNRIKLTWCTRDGLWEKIDKEFAYDLYQGKN